MTHFNCDKCDFYTNRKANYERHIITQKHIKTTKNHEKQRILEEITTKNNEFCKYCGKAFKHRNSMYHHIKYTCKKNKDEDLKELVRLLNLQIQQRDRELDYQKRQIDKLMDKLQVNNITNNTTNIHNNIQLLSYKDTDTSHLTNKDYIQALKQVTFCVKNLIEKIHFNPDKPENMNIYISNIKDKYLMVYEYGNWNLKTKTTELDSLYENKEILLEEWLDEYQYQYPELKEKFNRYLNNKEKDDVMNYIKDEIKLMMYNKRKTIENI